MFEQTDNPIFTMAEQPRFAPMPHGALPVYESPPSLPVRSHEPSEIKVSPFKIIVWLLLILITGGLIWWWFESKNGNKELKKGQTIPLGPAV